MYLRLRNTFKLRHRAFWIVVVPLSGIASWYLFLLILTWVTPNLEKSVVFADDRCPDGKWSDELRVVTWNLGYAGNEAESSFFLDGGKNVLASSKESVLQHLGSMVDFLSAHPVDIYLLQEVDSVSRRTYYVNEFEVIGNRLHGLCLRYALNHDVPFIPYTYFQPLGRIRSGIVSGSVRKPGEAKRYQLPGSLPWPDAVFHLQRCLLLSRFPRKHGNEWVVINIHLEAWDDGNVRKQELAFLADLAVKEYKRGNYVIVGGDWNSVLPGIDIEQFSTKEPPGPHTRTLPDRIFPVDWTWGVDRFHASNRRTNAPYNPGVTYTTIIDGFVVSPNVHIDFIKTVDELAFEDTDHEPVLIHVSAR